MLREGPWEWVTCQRRRKKRERELGTAGEGAASQRPGGRHAVGVHEEGSELGREQGGRRWCPSGGQ